MATAVPSNTDETIVLAAPVGGATYGTVIFNATLKRLYLPMTTAASGVNYTAKVLGRVNTIPKSTAGAFTGGQLLNWASTAASFKAYTAAGVAHAMAAADATAAATTCDVFLIHPVKAP